MRRTKERRECAKVVAFRAGEQQRTCSRRRINELGSQSVKPLWSGCLYRGHRTHSRVLASRGCYLCCRIRGLAIHGKASDEGFRVNNQQSVETHRMLNNKRWGGPSRRSWQVPRQEIISISPLAISGSTRLASTSRSLVDSAHGGLNKVRSFSTNECPVTLTPCN